MLGPRAFRKIEVVAIAWALAIGGQVSPLIVLALPTIATVLLLQRFTHTAGRLVAEIACGLISLFLCGGLIASFDQPASLLPSWCAHIPINLLVALLLLTLALALAEESTFLPSILLAGDQPELASP